MLTKSKNPKKNNLKKKKVWGDGEQVIFSKKLVLIFCLTVSEKTGFTHGRRAADAEWRELSSAVQYSTKRS